MNIEVYRVDSTKTEEMIFVAACEDAKADWKAQLDLLIKGIHPRKQLQAHFDRHGIEDLSMSVAKKVTSEDAMAKEIRKLCEKKEPEKEPEKQAEEKTKHIEVTAKIEAEDIKPPAQRNVSKRKGGRKKK